MAGLDITHVKTWKEYKEVRDWACKTDMIYPNGINGGKMIDWFYYPYLSELDFQDVVSMPLWNTTISVDMFLYKNCPVKFIQESLKDRYGDNIHELESNPINRHEKGRKVNLPKKMPRGIYDIRVKECGVKWLYSHDYDIWSDVLEFGPYNTNVCVCKVNSRKALVRKIRKWQLPKSVEICLRYYG